MAITLTYVYWQGIHLPIKMISLKLSWVILNGFRPHSSWTETKVRAMQCPTDVRSLLSLLNALSGLTSEQPHHPQGREAGGSTLNAFRHERFSLHLTHPRAAGVLAYLLSEHRRLLYYPFQSLNKDGLVRLRLGMPLEDS